MTDTSDDWSKLIEMRSLKRKGLSNAAIGKQMNISATTVGRKLKADPPKEVLVLEKMVEDLREAQQDLVNKLTEDPNVRELLELDNGFVARTETNLFNIHFIVGKDAGAEWAFGFRLHIQANDANDHTPEGIYA